MARSFNHLYGATLNDETGVHIWRKSQLFLDVDRFDLRCVVNHALCGLLPGD